MATAGSSSAKDTARSAARPPAGNLDARAGPRWLPDVILLAVLIATAVWLCLKLARVPGEVATVWLANGILAGWLLSRPSVRWPAYLAVGGGVELAIRLLAGDGVVPSIALGISNLVEVLIISSVIRRFVPDIGNPRSWSILGKVATGSTLGACAISGLVAAAALSASSGAPFLYSALIWYSAHVVGMVIVGTLTLVAHHGGIAMSGMPRQRWDFIACMLVIAVVCGLVFKQSDYPLLFMAFPPLVFAVLRHRFAGLAGGILLLAAIGSIATATGDGPLALLRSGGATGRTILLQLFIGTACLLGFPVALAMAERARLTARVRESETGYRMLADHSHDVVVRMRADGQRLYVSPSARDILGWEPGEMLEPGRSLVHPDDRAIQQQAIADVIAGDSVTTSYRMRHKQGHYVWMEADVRPIPGADGLSTDIIFTGRDITERMVAQQALQASRSELELQARMDSLTGLPNRRRFDERLALAISRSQRHDLGLALMYIDIDHFKPVNDDHGHAAGDEVLRVFGQRLGASVRAGDLVARVGGDEFIVLIEDLSSATTAERIARKLTAAMGEGIAIEGATLHVTASIGIAFSMHPAVAKTLTSAADAALYAAKKAGRNTWHLAIAGDVGSTGTAGPQLPEGLRT